MNLFSIFGSITVKTEEALKGIDEVSSKAEKLSDTLGKSMQDAGSKMSSVGKALAPVSVAVGGALTASTKSASDFTNGMAKMSTLFDTTKVNVGKLSKEFLGLSNETGKSATELAEAGYQALSASVPVEKLGGFVRTSANLAKVGFTETATAVDVMTTAINAYGMETEDADKIANNLVKTQNLGKTTVDELASSMGKIIPTASSMNVNLDNLCTVYTLLTKQGISTAEATTYANSMLNEMGDSGTTVGGILKDQTGKSFQELMADGNSLGDVLTILQNYAKETGTNFNELWGSSEAGKAAIALLNGGADEFNSTLAQMTDSTDVLGKGLEKLNTPSAQISKALNQVKNSGIEMGTAFLTSLAPTIEKVATGIEKATTWFNGLSEGTKTTISTVMAMVAVLSPALVIGGKIIGGIGSIVTAVPQIVGAVSGMIGFITSTVIPFIGTIVSTIGLVPLAIAGIIAVITVLWNKCDWFREGVIAIWEAIKSAAIMVWNAIKDFLVGLWDGIVQTGKAVFEGLASFFSTCWQGIQIMFTTVLNAIKVVFGSVWEGIKNIVTVVVTAIQTFLTTAWNTITTVITTVLTTLQTIFSTVWEAIKTVVTTVIEVIKNFIVTAWEGIKSTITGILNIIKDVFSAVWNAIKTTISNVIDGVKSRISDGLNGAKSIVSDVLGAIKEKFSNIFEGAKEIVSGAIERIKGFFNFDWSLPKLKLPHFKLSGEFSLDPLSVPHIGVEWYKKAMGDGMIMNQPTIFGYNPKSNQLMAGGEAGSETVVGTGSLLDMIKAAVAAENSMVAEKLDALLSLCLTYFPRMSQMQMVTDTGALIGELSPGITKEVKREISQEQQNTRSRKGK